VEPLVNIVYILKLVCIYQPVNIVSIIRSARVKGKYRFLCVVGSEEKWLSKGEISEDSYKEYRRMQKGESKWREVLNFQRELWTKCDAYVFYPRIGLICS